MVYNYKAFHNGVINKLSRFAVRGAAAAMAAVLCFSSVFWLGAEKASAESSYAFAIEKYQLEANVTKGHTFEIHERLSVSIPQDMASLKLVLLSGGSVVTDLDVGSLGYSTSMENGTQYITITSTDDLKAGEHVYDIRYVVNELAENDDIKDTFYFNALLPEWRQPIGEVEMKISLPEDFPWDELQYYAGKFGTSDVADKLSYKVDKKAGIISIKGSRIPENYGVTLMADLPNGYWTNPLDGRAFVMLAAGIAGVMTLVVFVMWLIGGRDPRTGRTKETHPIEGISPAELGFIFDGKVTKRDIIALLLYLGTKGCLRISEYKPRKFRLYRLEDPKGEEKFIRNAYNILFENVYKGRYIELEDAGPRLRRILDTIPVDIENGFPGNDMKAHTPMSKFFRIVSIALAVVAASILPVVNAAYRFIDVSYGEVGMVFAVSLITLITACVLKDKSFDDNSRLKIAGATAASAVYVGICVYQILLLAAASHLYLICLALTACYVLMMLLIVLMTARGKENVKLVARYKALRKFIYKAEPKDVEEFYKENPDYYYDMVPYAYLFQGLESWARTFRWMGVPDPVWYTDDIEGHAITHAKHKDTTFDHAKSIKSFCRTLESGYVSMQRHYLYK